jgi:uncharacterized protein (DUF3820 family)
MDKKDDISHVADWSIPFGKYKGVKYDDLLKKDMKYVRWLLDNNIINNDKVINYLKTNLKI